ncbi:histidine kinase [Halorhodospira abdelmalekii]|uniref:HDOD domain-containing protein n=1 Tax=Halorhodospira abdelmalekii TaxID=421629 RepID=UPI001903D86A|nr:HDOD domain-containing protein [Halorhodospira abdelmalekii]MBK1734118.1 histidine kinase [Halorhodospira abdelmalekii]
MPDDRHTGTSAAGLLATTDTLPVLPYIAHEILVTTSTNDVDIATVAKVLGREPGLTARIIAVANYAFFSRRETIYSLERAIMRIGLNRVRVLATSLLLNQVFDTSKCPAFHLERYWYESIATAFCAARLAPHTLPEHGSEAAYLGGVLHNIGLLLLVHVFPNAMNDILSRRQDEPDRPLSLLTFQELGCDYHEAGEMLLHEWQLPEAIVAVAGGPERNRYGAPAARGAPGTHGRLIETVEFAHHWVQAGLEGIEAPAALQIEATTLQRIGAACAEEHEPLAAFARLLAGNDTRSPATRH